MRVTVISDLHGAVDRLRAAAAECDALVVLGDLINVLDYHDMDGILVDIFGREPVAAAAQLRTNGRFDEARETLRAQADPELDFRARFAQLAARQYEEVLGAMPAGTVITYGNVDVPDLLRSMLPADIRLVDGGSFELAGLRWGIVGGGVRTPLGVPGEVPDEDWVGKLEALGDVDVVGTHMPPRIPWYCYDTVAAKFEPGSTPLLAFIQERQPRYALFGHVHQPLMDRGGIGRTELVNVGHFRATGRGWTYEVAD
jgi:Icc-related predicted phosphoesterase